MDSCETRISAAPECSRRSISSQRLVRVAATIANDLP
jgi:hypothetical protein